MPAFLAIPWVAALIGGLISAAATFAGRALIGIGFGLVTYTGFNALLSAFASEAKELILQAPYNALAIAGLLQVDVAISMLFSAISMRLLINGLRGGAIKKWVAK